MMGARVLALSSFLGLWGLPVAGVQAPAGGSVGAGSGAPVVAVADDSVQVLVPRSAFLRSLVVPGWGHALAGSYTRGGVYFSIQSATLWMLRKSWIGRAEAERTLAIERRAVRDRLVGEGVVNTVDLATGVEADLSVQRRAGLARVRGEQVEDWLAFSIFMTLLGATDAYVSAHLVGYPEPLAFRVLPAQVGEGIELRWTVPLAPR